MASWHLSFSFLRFGMEVTRWWTSGRFINYVGFKKEGKLGWRGGRFCLGIARVERASRQTPLHIDGWAWYLVTVRIAYRMIRVAVHVCCVVAQHRILLCVICVKRLARLVHIFLLWSYWWFSFTLLWLIDLIIFLSPFVFGLGVSCLCCRYCKQCFLFLYNFTIGLLIHSFIIVFAPSACVYWPLRYQIPRDRFNIVTQFV